MREHMRHRLILKMAKPRIGFDLASKVLATLSPLARLVLGKTVSGIVEEARRTWGYVLRFVCLLQLMEKWGYFFLPDEGLERRFMSRSMEFSLFVNAAEIFAKSAVVELEHGVERRAARNLENNVSYKGHCHRKHGANDDGNLLRKGQMVVVALENLHL